MPGRRSEPTIHGPDAYLSAIRDSGQALRQKYFDDPAALAERFGLKLPRKPVYTMIDRGIITEEEAKERFGDIKPGLRDLVLEVCLGEVESAAAVGPRGGGKSQGVSFVEFFLVLVRMFDALNLGGSELQADQVYRYLLSYIESDPYWRTLIKGDPMKERTDTTDDAWIRVLTASSKSVRSPHAGGRKRSGRIAGGILVIDEEAEAEASIVSAALFTINTAQPSVNIRSSTFHNASGSFAELIDDHEDMGYKLYQWDIFDVCAGCDCPPDPDGKCGSTEKCFAEDHIEVFPDPITGQEQERIVHKAYCGGRARYATGWVPMAEVYKTYRRIKRNHAVWEVEQMGSRPTSKGYVIENREEFKRRFVPDMPSSLYKPNYATYVCVDWGTGHCGIEVWQHQGDKHVLLECEQLEETGPTEQIAKIVGFVQRYIDTFAEIRGDLGGGGNYMNKMLTEQYGYQATDVAFSETKEAAARVFNIFSEAQGLVIPELYDQFKDQVNKWRRVNGRINKGNDHLCDTALCYFSRFIEELGLEHVRIGPKVFDTLQQRAEEQSKMDTSAPKGNNTRIAVVRTFGGRR